MALICLDTREAGKEAGMRWEHQRRQGHITVVHGQKLAEIVAKIVEKTKN